MGCDPLSDPSYTCTIPLILQAVEYGNISPNLTDMKGMDVPYAFCGSLTRSFTVLDDIMKASLAFTDKCCVRVSNLTDLAL